jgi:AcrR family transcriptional regulator
VEEMCTETDVRERIIKAAMKVFAQYGYFKAPVKLIAMEAGVSKGLVFWYFRSKDELILEIAARTLPLDVIKECIEKKIVGNELLKCIGLNYLGKYEDPIYKNLLLHTLSAETVYPRIKEEVRNICEEYVSRIAEKVYGSREKTYRIHIRAFFGALLCYTLRPPKDISKEEYVENLIKLILHK